MIQSYVYQDKAMRIDTIKALVRKLRMKLTHNIMDNMYHISTLIKMEESIKTQLETLKNENIKLKAENKILLKKSMTDSLTGLYNRNKMKDIFHIEQSTFTSHNNVLCIILIDLDDFKSINDVHGHNIGDIYLQKISTILRNVINDVNIVGRWGGEEFIVLLPRTTLSKAAEVASKINISIKELNCPTVGLQTASCGVAHLKENDTLNALVGRADEALFQAKAQGKDRIVIKST